MKFLETVNKFFIKNPFLVFLFIFFFFVLPIIMNVIKEVDKEIKKDMEKIECVQSTVQINPNLIYKIKSCSNQTVELVAINGKPLQENN